MPSIKTSFATVSLFILFLFACVALVAEAQAVTPQERFEAMQEARDAQQSERTDTQEERATARASSTEERQIERVARQEERRTMLNERAVERVRNLAANISNRMDAAIMRLEQITTRLETRITLLKETGADTTAAEASLETAKDALARAVSSIADIDARVAAVVGSESPREAWTVTRATFAEVKTDLQVAQASLRASVAALKVAVAEAGTGNGVSQAVSNTPEEAEPITTEAAE